MKVSKKVKNPDLAAGHRKNALDILKMAISMGTLDDRLLGEFFELLHEKYGNTAIFDMDEMLVLAGVDTERRVQMAKKYAIKYGIDEDFEAHASWMPVAKGKISPDNALAMNHEFTEAYKHAHSLRDADNEEFLSAVNKALKTLDNPTNSLHAPAYVNRV